jgi:hypothetical protein
MQLEMTGVGHCTQSLIEMGYHDLFAQAELKL